MKTDAEIIAEFDGWIRNQNINRGSRIQWTHPEKSTWLTETLAIPTTPERMKYATSWDWLMPVVEKIEQLHDSSYLCRIVSYRCIIYDSNIAAVYKSVVEFIKWHNDQKGVAK